MKNTINKVIIYTCAIALIATYFIAPINSAHALGMNNISITPSYDSATIKWDTDLPATTKVEYGVALDKLTWRIQNDKRTNYHSITINDLTSGFTYYVKATSIKDGIEISSSIYSFRTQNLNSQIGSGATSTSINSGVSSDINACKINFQTDFGYYGAYYNLPENHPDNIPWQGTRIYAKKTAAANDWYSSKYFSFTKINEKLNFSNKFYPVNEGLKGDPSYFAVHWRAIMYAPTDGNYQYSITSNDDSWLYIDDKLASDLNGIHFPLTDNKTVYLSAGYHELEIYYADRSPGNAVMIFSPDSSLEFYPLPLNCSIEKIINYNKNLNTSTTNDNFDSLFNDDRTGTVLGVSNINDSVNTNYSTNNILNVGNKYVCNSDLGYTPFKAVYKTANSPAIWAILENNQKHYISSPAAFYKYGCNWGEVRVVSQVKLDNYPNAKLVRTPTNPQVYYLFQRPNIKWLKINIPSTTIFVSYSQNYWGNVIKIDQLDIDAYPSTRLIKTPNSSAIYLIEGKAKRLIKSPEVFEKHNFSWAEITEINQLHLDTYQDGAVLN